MASRGDGRQLVGRESAVAALRSAAEAAAAGRGQLMLVTGEAGIGKTALLAEVAADAGADGTLVLWAQCWEGDGAPAYWPWVQVLRAGIAAGGDAGDASMLLPEQATNASPRVSAAADARFRLFDAVASFLGRLAQRRPVLVVLDDLQWADEASLRLLEFAARHLTAHRVLVLGGYRDEEAGLELRRLAARSEQVQLGALVPADVAALMTALTGAPPPGDVAVDVWRRTGGNPFLARELTRLLVAQGSYRQQATTSGWLLATVGDILERRLARLSQPCVTLLTVAAVAGPEVRLDVLVKLADNPDDVPQLLDEAVEARVLAAFAPPGPFRFSHDLFRETILAGLARERRAELHLQIGRVLESLRDEGRSVHPAQLAAHFTAAAVAAPEEAVRYALLAAEEATARLAFEEARAHYERTLAAIELRAAGESADRLDVLLLLADARNRAGDVKEAHSAYRDAAALARSLADATALATAAMGVHALGWRHVHAEAIALLEEAARALPDAPSALRAGVLAALARDLHHSYEERDWDRAPVLAEQAVATARRLRDPGTLAFSLLALHDACWRPGNATERLAVADEMLAASEEAADPEMLAQARLLRATALVELGDPAGPAELEAYCRHSEQLGHARARYGALTRRATAALIAGDLAHAEALAAEGHALGEAIGEADARGVYETLRWGVRFAGGSWEADASSASTTLDSRPWPGLPLLEAVLHVDSGDREAARGALARLHLDELPATHDLELLTFVAYAVVAAGSDEQRRRVYEMLRRYAGVHVVVGGCASYFGAVDHYLGLLARSLGLIDDARGHFASAAALHERLGAQEFAQRSCEEADACASELSGEACVFRHDGGVWTIAYGEIESHLPDVKGLHDLAVLLSSPGQSVHAVELHTGHPPDTGADEVLDARAKAAYRRRLAELENEIDEAEVHHDPYRAERARAERQALIAELSAAVGLGGRDRRLGDERERARKAVTARIREAIARIERANPRLGKHLTDAVQTGTWCMYSPAEQVRWSL